MMPSYSPGSYAVILAARMSSGRLPGKCIAELAPGVPVLNQIVARWHTSLRNPVVVVTTTTDPADDPIADAASAAGVFCSRGHPANVVAQMDLAVQTFAPRARYVARALADNPLVDVDLADYRLDKLIEAGADGLWYGMEKRDDGTWRARHERLTYAGTTDVWSRAAWDKIAEHSSGSELEHPGAFYWNHIRDRDVFNVRLLPLPRAEYVTNIRTELDEPADLAMFRAVWQAWQDAGYSSPLVDTLWALRWLAENPDAANLNRAVKLKTQSAVGERRTRRPRYCAHCHGETAQVYEAGIEFRCPTCGTADTYYRAGPKAR